jgi:UDP-glucose 4-epimerase
MGVIVSIAGAGNLAKRALLIGGTGFIGRNLAQSLRDDGYEVMVTGRPAHDETDGYGRGDVLRRVPLDLRDVDGVAATLRDVRPDIVFHLACNLLPASTAAEYFAERRDLIEPSMALVNQLAAKDTRFVFLSSGGTVYGPVDTPLIAEDQDCRPISFYGQAKLEFETYLRFAARTMGLRYLVIRPSNPFGPGQSLDSTQGLIAVLIGKALRNEPVDVWGDGGTVRDYIHIDDLCGAMRHLVDHGHGLEHGSNVFNIGSGIGHSLLDVVAEVQHAIGRGISLTFHPPRTVDVRRAVLDVTRLAATGAPQARPLDQGIDSFVARVARAKP